MTGSGEVELNYKNPSLYVPWRSVVYGL